MGPLSGKKDENKEKIKEMLKQLHSGAKVEEVRAKYKGVLEGMDVAEIGRIEDELVKEGMPVDEIHRLCDVHLALFKDQLESQKPLAEPGHPIHTLMEEHKAMLGFANELKAGAGQMKGAKDSSAAEPQTEKVRKLAGFLKEAEKHYLREENILFSYIEKHGITQPPAVMWSEHDKIRKIKKGIYRTVDNRGVSSIKEFSRRLEESAVELAETLSSHFYKENNVLYPTALKIIDGAEWGEVKTQCDEIGYMSYSPETAKVGSGGVGKAGATGAQVSGGRIEFETGFFSVEELQSALDTMPVDITFVGADDTVRYFSNSKDRIFPRAKGIIGRKVQNCHPSKSLPKVEQIVQGFKDRTLDKAEFWINIQGRLIYIRYFPVRNAKGEYLGVIEVSQDIAPLKKIVGEKRLL
jgi:hypothetical protein